MYGVMQDYSNPSALIMELLQVCAKPSISTYAICDKKHTVYTLVCYGSQKLLRSDQCYMVLFMKYFSQRQWDGLVCYEGHAVYMSF